MEDFVINKDSAAYKKGYATGITWDADWKPGGPWYYTVEDWRTDEQKAVARQLQQENRDWLAGWEVGNAFDPFKPITRFLYGFRKRV